MADDATQAHIDHLRWEQEHLRWNADHMRALAILRRVEAHLFEHEHHTILHRAEIFSHDETIAHGADHLPSDGGQAHAAMGEHHEDGARNHDNLMKAIFALEAILA